MDIKTMRKFTWEQSQKAAHEAWQLYRLSPYDRVYLYYKRGELKAARNQPEGFELAFPEKLPGYIPLELASWIHNRIGSIPFLPVE